MMKTNNIPKKSNWGGKLTKRIIGMVLSIAILASVGTTVMAEDVGNEKTLQINTIIERLNFEYQESGIVVDKLPINTISNENKFLYEFNETELYNFFKDAFETAKNIEVIVEPIELSSSTIQPRWIGSGNYTTNFRVWFGIPSIGFSDVVIRSHYSVNSDGYFTSASVENSWLEGFAIFGWSHSWGEANIGYYNTYVDLIAHGTVDYVIPNTNIGVHSPESVLYQLRGVDY